MIGCLSIASVKEHFRIFNRKQDVLEFATSSATVEMAAETIGVLPDTLAH